MRVRRWVGWVVLAIGALWGLGCGDGGDDEGNDVASETADEAGGGDGDADADADGDDDAVGADGDADGDDDGAGADGDADGDDDGTGPAPGEPLYASAGWYETTIAASGDPADVYYPEGGAAGERYPLAVLLQGAKVDRSHYSDYAALVARYGFVVVVPNHTSTTLLGTGLYAEQDEPAQVLEQLRAESGDPGSPVYGRVDDGVLVLLGHSYGGVAGMNVIRNVCMPPSCSGGFPRPDELAGGAFFGTNMATPVIGTVPDIANHGLPLALIQGTVDSKARLDQARATYDKIQDPPKALVAIAGSNHYGICNVNNPPGADADRTAPTLDQAVGVETAARWSALFLRARVLGDPDAVAYLETLGDPADPHVEITQEW